LLPTSIITNETLSNILMSTFAAKTLMANLTKCHTYFAMVVKTLHIIYSSLRNTY
jgi:hypothetical protein